VAGKKKENTGMNKKKQNKTNARWKQKTKTKFQHEGTKSAAGAAINQQPEDIVQLKLAT